MQSLRSAARGGAAALLFVLGTACSQNSSLGDILGGVLGGGGGSQVSGSIAGVNTRLQQVGIQQSNGQTVTLNYDNNTNAGQNTPAPKVYICPSDPSGPIQNQVGYYQYEAQGTQYPEAVLEGTTRIVELGAERPLANGELESAKRRITCAATKRARKKAA